MWKKKKVSREATKGKAGEERQFTVEIEWPVQSMPFYDVTCAEGGSARLSLTAISGLFPE